LADQVAQTLPDGLSHVLFESRVGLGQRFGQVAQIMGLALLVTALR
jgi:hypothetical protein